MLSNNVFRWVPSGELFVQLKTYLGNELQTQIGRCQILYSSLPVVAPRLKTAFDYLTSMMTQMAKYLVLVAAALGQVLATPSILQPTPPMGESFYKLKIPAKRSVRLQ